MMMMMMMISGHIGWDVHSEAFWEHGSLDLPLMLMSVFPCWDRLDTLDSWLTYPEATIVRNKAEERRAPGSCHNQCPLMVLLLLTESREIRTEPAEPHYGGEVVLLRQPGRWEVGGAITKRSISQWGGLSWQVKEVQAPSVQGSIGEEGRRRLAQHKGRWQFTSLAAMVIISDPLLLQLG